MMAGSHVVVGMAAAWAWAAPHLGLPPLDPVALALAAGGSLLPDNRSPAILRRTTGLGDLAAIDRGDRAPRLDPLHRGRHRLLSTTALVRKTMV